jgi:hypothetical protein
LIKVFVLCWQALCLAWLISYFVAVGGVHPSSDAEAAGVAIGGMMGTGFIIGIWVGVTILAAVVGLFLKKDTTEVGPTGPRR